MLQKKIIIEFYNDAYLKAKTERHINFYLFSLRKEVSFLEKCFKRMGEFF